jgi:hypothetical protein
MNTTKLAYNEDFSSSHSQQPRKKLAVMIHFVNGGNGEVTLIGLHILV